MSEINEVKSRFMQDCRYFREHVGDEHAFFYGGPVLCDNRTCSNYINSKFLVEGDGNPIGACSTYGFATKERAQLYFENKNSGLIGELVKGVVNEKIIDEVF